MLNFELLQSRNILIVTPGGPLERGDFSRLTQELEAVVKSRGKLAGLLVYVVQFPGWKNFGAFSSHLKFVATHHRQIDKIAAVTNSKGLEVMSRIARYFIHPTIKHFNLEQETQALAWLEA